MSRREEIAWSKGSDLIVPQERFGDILAAAADIVIAVDPDGMVQSILTNPSDQHLGCLDHWVGRDLREFLTEECHPKLDSALKAVSGGGPATPVSTWPCAATRSGRPASRPIWAMGARWRTRR